MLPALHEWVSKCPYIPNECEKKALSAKENEGMSCYGEVAYRSELNQWQRWKTFWLNREVKGSYSLCSIFSTKKSWGGLWIVSQIGVQHCHPIGPHFSGDIMTQCIVGGKTILLIMQHNLRGIISVNGRVGIWTLLFLTPMVFSCLYIMIFLVLICKIGYYATYPIFYIILLT